MTVQPGQRNLAPSCGVDLPDQVPVELDQVRDLHLRSLEISPDVLERKLDLLDWVWGDRAIDCPANLAGYRQPPARAADFDVVTVGTHRRMDGVRVAMGFHLQAEGEPEAGVYLAHLEPIQFPQTFIQIALVQGNHLTHVRD